MIWRNGIYPVLLSLLILVAGLSQVNAQAGEASLDSLLVKAERAYDDFQEEQALETYKDVLDRDSTQYEALWRTSFLYSRIGNRLEEESRKRAYFDKARHYAQKALDQQPDDAQSNFVMAVAMGRKALIAGARERVAASRDIKKYAEKAIKADSTLAGAWHVLGRWHLKVANLNFIERMAANALFGGIPEGASEQKAVQYLRKAIKLEPRYILYHYDLARALDETGQDEEAVKVLGKALTLKPLTPDDPELLKKCRKLRSDLQ